MCGIVGFAARKNCLGDIFDSLEKLEYRGYDSAGVGFFESGELKIIKAEGKVKTLAPLLEGHATCVGIGHTRWATHGKPCDLNAHPHSGGHFAIVHNGIIENYAQLKEKLEGVGLVPVSGTDTELIALLLELYYSGDPLAAIRKTIAELKGSYAVAALCKDYEDRVFLIKKDNPLIVGRGKDFNCFASDTPALVKHTDTICKLSDGDIAVLTADNIEFYDKNRKIQKNFITTPLKEEYLTKGSYESYMLKEINEIPHSVHATLSALGSRELSRKTLSALKKTRHVLFLGCGSAYHAGIYGKYLTENATSLTADCETAGEFRYRKTNLPKHTLAVAISQSGETADTINALKKARAMGAYTLTVTNVPASTVTNLADDALLTSAGAEISVAATKSFNTQLSALFYLISELAKLGHRRYSNPYYVAEKLFSALTEAVRCGEEMKQLSEIYADCRNVFFLGRGFDYPIAREASLKMKEISYIDGEGCPAGEIKHGTLALVTENTLTVHLITDRAVKEKSLNVVNEVRARGAKVLIITCFDDLAAAPLDKVVRIPSAEAWLMPIISVIPCQFFAYYSAIIKNCDPDKPRNLAKSVTVE